MLIEKRYLVVPVSRYSQRKFLIFSDKNGIVMDYRVRLCTREPEYHFYIDMRFAVGRQLDFHCEPKQNYTPVFADEIPSDGLYKEKFRPTAHFSAARGWINDPNGPVYFNGLYHLFFQYNPAGPNWSNMHWGHAVSHDLLHWEEKETALFPDSLGTVYSGSAVVDYNNVTGLKENENDVLLLFYTACSAGMKLSAGSKTSQCLAYSTDGGETFKKYAGNPIIPNIVGDNRDPKVVYSDEEKIYYMALFLNKDEYALFTSDNLLEWRRIQTFRLENDGECPDFYPLSDRDGERFWVFTGAHDKYVIGKLKNGKFDIIQPPKSLNFGDKSYAAQTFSGLPENRRIRMAWNRSTPPESYFNSSMCTPAQMTLTRDSSGEIYLCINPTENLKDIAFPCSADCLEGKAHDIRFDFTFCGSSETEVSLLGFNFTVSSLEHRIKVGNFSVPLFDSDGKASVRLITDTDSVEIYANGGRAFGVFEHIADYDLCFADIKLLSGKATVEVTAAGLKNIWE